MVVRTLGLTDYLEAWELQKELVARRLSGEVPDTLLLLEHPPVYTRGASSKAPVPPGLPHPLHSVERGGDLTYHGPGQLVGYPILHLGELGLRARSYLRLIESVLIDAAGGLGLPAETVRGFTGVWSRGKKIASIGVAVKDQVAYHGFALNVSCDLAPFSRIHPCRLEPERMGTLSGLLGRPVAVAEASRRVAEAFEAALSPLPAAR